MKKLTLVNCFIVVVALLLTVGCNDLLESPTPATSVPGEQVLTSEEGVEGLRASLYSRLRASFDYTTEYFIGPSAIADETRNRPGSSRFQGLNSVTGNDGNTNGLSSYGDTYEIILDANLMISAVEDGVLPQEKLDRYRGEAYAIRAMAMHHLTRALGYEPGGEVDSWDLGIPLVTEPTQDISDVGEVPRATNTEVYNQILDDLGQAEGLLAGQTDNTRITEAFVHGLKARVNLYAGNWDAADQAAGDAISSSDQSLATEEETVANMFNENGPNHPEALFKVVVDPNTEPIAGSNVNDGLASYTATTWVAQLPTNAVIDLYDQDDYRIGSYVYDENGDPVMNEETGRQAYEGGWYGPCYNQRGNEIPDGCHQVNDDSLEVQKWNGDKGQQADDIPYMRIAEMYLIQAEARAKANNSVADGIGPLNTLRAARGLDPVTPVDFNSVEEFEDEILDERVRELVVEGHRFWDLKRLGRKIPNPDGSTKIRYDSYRILDNIGAGNISANPALEENPGY